MENCWRRITFSLKKVVACVLIVLIIGTIIFPDEVDGGKKKKRRGKRGRMRGRSNDRDEIRTDDADDDSNEKDKDQPPHIVFILADDLGWNDVGYHGSEIDTPVIDELAKKGVKLENYYSQAICSPTRASIMTGRYQSRTGINRILDASEVGCMPVHLTTLPERLKVYGYFTHLVGKWHLGYSRKACLPTRRGFDSFLGPYTGYVDHFDRTKLAMIHNRTYGGYDFHKDEEPSYLYEDKYSTHVYTREAKRLIRRYARKKKPMFLFLSLQAVHTPNQAPKYYLNSYENRTENGMRLSHAAMTTCMDTAVGRIHEALVKYNIWQNTVLIFSSDNGGAYKFGSDNAPLRGSKGNYYEGGIRVAAFMTSPLIPRRARGSVYSGLMGAADWFPTLVDGIAGGSTKYLAMDGINMWESIRTGVPSDRVEYLFAVGGDCNWEPGNEIKDIPLYGTIRIGVWKLILGQPMQKPHRMAKKAVRHEIRLYNLAYDQTETKNLYATHYFIVHSLLQRLKHHCRTRLPYVPLEESEFSDPKYHDGVFQPWLDHKEIAGGISGA